MLQHPDWLYRRPTERAYIDPNNAVVLRQHLLCAAFEVPLFSPLLSEPTRPEMSCREDLFAELSVFDECITELQAWGALQTQSRGGGSSNQDRPGRSPILELVPAGWRDHVISQPPSAWGPFSSQPASEVSPSVNVTIRNIDEEMFDVVTYRDETTTSHSSSRASSSSVLRGASSSSSLPIVLDQLPSITALFYIHPGAVFMYQGQPYLVSSLDLTSKVAVVEPTGVQYFTHSRDHTDVQELHVSTRKSLLSTAPATAFSAPLSSSSSAAAIAVAFTEHGQCELGRVSVFTKVYGYYRFQKHTGRILELVDMQLPVISSTRSATWIALDPSLKTRVDALGLNFTGACHAINHAIMSLLPLIVMAEASDVATECIYPHETRIRPPRLMLYETHGNGTGLAEQIYNMWPTLLAQAHTHISACPCSTHRGCPRCVQVRVIHAVISQTSYFFLECA
jgi:ATP-dependent helicase YprA (DUF1998 family)